MESLQLNKVKKISRSKQVGANDIGSHHVAYFFGKGHFIQLIYRGDTATLKESLASAWHDAHSQHIKHNNNKNHFSAIIKSSA